MGIRCYLAMTQEEQANCPAFPPHLGWMACHFSPYGRGLTDLPSELPPGSLLICDDRIPVLHHDEKLVAQQLTESAKTLNCSAILLDFQVQGYEKVSKIVETISSLAPCPVAVTPGYAAASPGPVLMPPPKLWEPISKAAKPWQGRELWMEWAIQAAKITVTEEGSTFSVLEKPPGQEETDRVDDALCCCYRVELGQHRAEFLLWDSAETLEQKKTAAQQAGITTLVGLYQQFQPP